MKRYERDVKRKQEKYRVQEWKREHNAGGFRCSHCRQFVVINDIMGTSNRNHCNWCLWSKHVDQAKGDRQSACQGGMKPRGLTFKHEGQNKVGEIMLIHLCSSCQKISINRIARDDPEDMILQIFESSLACPPQLRQMLAMAQIDLLNASQRREVHRQLFGG